MIIGDITYNISITFPVEKNIPCGMFTAFSFEKGVLQIFPVSVEPHFSCMGEVIMWRMR